MGVTAAAAMADPATCQPVGVSMMPALPAEVMKQRYDDRGDPWWCPQKPWILNLLRLPYRTYKQLFFYSRPDTTHKITRAAEWRHVNSEWRYMHSLFVYIGRPSNILCRVRIPLFINMLVAVALVIVEERRANGSTVLIRIPSFGHEAVIQMFGTTSFVLALLMALRHNRTYERWWDAWRSFRRVGDCAAALTQQAAVHCPDDPSLQAEVARWGALWCYALVQFCSGAKCIDPLAARLLGEREKALYDAAPNKFNLVELKLRKLIRKMGLPTDQALSVDNHLREGWQCVRTCSTIKQTALPYALTLVCTGFIEIALILLPIAFISGPYRTLTPSQWQGERIAGAALLLGLYMIINLLMLGSDEVAAQMEDPFLVLPLCDRTEMVVDLIRRTFDEAAEFDEIEVAAVLSSRGHSRELGELERAETLTRLESIVIQSMHAEDLASAHLPTVGSAGAAGNRRISGEGPFARRAHQMGASPEPPRTSGLA